MSCANRSLFLRSAVLLLIMVAQLLTPLLHGHFGTPNQAGLHVHPHPSRVADSHLEALRDLHADDHPALQHAEPFEVDVQTSLQPLIDLPLFAAVGLILLSIGLQAAHVRCNAPKPLPRLVPEPLSARWRGRIIKPSPSQAPPLAA
ncbi:hypothetical protein [Comamonas composti]|uniref:hypothetical protein n=1 Tax=Comamonas composti TaxID=408558 RepID=UPI00047B7A9E|nr:hypothetical protein [Comamonas composti]